MCAIPLQQARRSLSQCPPVPIYSLRVRRVDRPQGVSTLLGDGRHAALVPSAAAAAAQPGPPAWRLPPHTAASVPHAVHLRELGLQQRGAAPPLALRSPWLHTRGVRHLRTVRGHRLPVYCVKVDRTGGRVVTGADDWLVKVG